MSELLEAYQGQYRYRAIEIDIRRESVRILLAAYPPHRDMTFTDLDAAIQELQKWIVPTVAEYADAVHTYIVADQDDSRWDELYEVLRQLDQRWQRVNKEGSRYDN